MQTNGAPLSTKNEIYRVKHDLAWLLRGNKYEICNCNPIKRSTIQSLQPSFPKWWILELEALPAIPEYASLTVSPKEAICKLSQSRFE